LGTIKDKYGEEVTNVFQVKEIVQNIQEKRNKKIDEISENIKKGHSKRDKEDIEKTVEQRN